MFASFVVFLGGARGEEDVGGALSSRAGVRRVDTIACGVVFVNVFEDMREKREKKMDMY